MLFTVSKTPTPSGWSPSVVGEESGLNVGNSKVCV